ncbi:hypothetical protein TNCV_3279781 [Trichonephila clavipes]|nr:hypothetical protein TNCV_3279781 [Trichonephila clavipes]
MRDFGDRPRMWNHGQVTRKAPELATASPNYHTNGRMFELSTDLMCIASLGGGSLVLRPLLLDLSLHLSSGYVKPSNSPRCQPFHRTGQHGRPPGGSIGPSRSTTAA